MSVSVLVAVGLGSPNFINISNVSKECVKGWFFIYFCFSDVSYCNNLPLIIYDVTFFVIVFFSLSFLSFFFGF